MDATTEPRGLRPGMTVEGELRPPGSKSIAQRALLLSAVSRGRTVLGGLPTSDDVRACLTLVQELGAEVEPIGTDGALVGGTGGTLLPAGSLQAGESGTLARLATGLVGLCAERGRPVQVRARGSLLERSSPALFRALSAAGVGLRFASHADGWPVELTPARAEEALVLNAPGSSQELSALLLAAAVPGGVREVRVHGRVPSRPYLAITADVLRRFGATVEVDGGPDEEAWRVRGPLRAPEDPLLVEADASSGAVLLVAACLSGGSVRVRGVGEGSSQGDVRIVEHLRAFGCEAFAEPAGLVARGRPRRSAELDLAGEPDLAPVLAVVAACAAGTGGTSTLGGLGSLRGKESDRIAVLAAGLARAGFGVRSGPDWLRIGPPTKPPSGAVLLDPAGDHRMAFAFALVGLLREGVSVLDPGCVAKSWPGFWEVLERLGAGSSPRSEGGS